MRTLARLSAFLVGCLLLAAGGFGLAVVHAPTSGATGHGTTLLQQLAQQIAPDDPGAAAARLRAGLSGAVARHALPAGGLLLLGLALKPARRRRARRPSRPRGAKAKPGAGEAARAEAAAKRPPEADAVPGLDRRTRRRVNRETRKLLREGRVVEAAELLLDAGDLDAAADHFVEAGALVRGAELHQRQGRLVQAAELFEEAGQLEHAARLFAEGDQLERAAGCFEKAGQVSVAAELLERMGAFERAAQCYASACLHRQAAEAWARCQRWGDAARAFETVIAEETAQGGFGPETAAGSEARKLALRACQLYEEAGEPEKAAALLERAGCLREAGELFLRLGHLEQAAALFQRVDDAPLAAEALRRQGQEKEAARILAEHHRSRGEDLEAAKQFEAAGDLEAAAEHYRQLEDFPTAAAFFERCGNALQAAELYDVAGELERAAQLYEEARRYELAAERYAALERPHKQADMLSQAGRFFEAAQVLSGIGEQDAAIQSLQKVPAGSSDQPQAARLLARHFRERQMHSLAIATLRQALGDASVDTENIDLFYTLGLTLEDSGEYDEAAELFERLLAFDFQHQDVRQRLEAVRERAKLRPRGAGVGTSTSGEARYETLEELGRGGMGIVYKARDTVLDRIVALKVLPETLKGNPQALRNFLREAKSAARLNHPNIVTVYDAGEYGDSYYIAMEYVDGTTLKQILQRRGVISPKGVLHVLVQMCEALAYAHDKKIVHRDIKTGNVMWTREKKVKIMDFGLAKVIEEVRNHTTVVAGTPFYMSPEQTLGKNVDQRSDIYSLGVALFELATGRTPFSEGNVPYHHVHTPAPDAREVNPQVPAVLAAIIARCLAKEPAERFGSAHELLAEVRALAAPKS